MNLAKQPRLKFYISLRLILLIQTNIFIFGDPQDINAARLISSPDVEKRTVYSLERSWNRQGSVCILYFTLSGVKSRQLESPTHPLLSQEEAVW